MKESVFRFKTFRCFFSGFEPSNIRFSCELTRLGPSLRIMFPILLDHSLMVSDPTKFGRRATLNYSESASVRVKKGSSCRVNFMLIFRRCLLLELCSSLLNKGLEYSSNLENVMGSNYFFVKMK